MESPNRTTGRAPRSSDAASVQHAQELRQRILSAARDVFVEKGYDLFSMRQIAQRIGYSATTIYLHFKDRDEILLALVTDAFERFKDVLETAAMSTDDPILRLESIGTACISFALENPGDYQIMFMQRRDLLMMVPLEGHAPLIESFHVLTDAVSYAVEKGALVTHDERALADVMWAGVHGLASLSIGTPMLSTRRLMAALPMFNYVVGFGAGWVDKARPSWDGERAHPESYQDGTPRLTLPPTVEL